jgi:hypothetical protein
VNTRSPIEDVLDDFFAAIAEQGKPAPEEPISAEDLATVAEAVAPLLLPPSLVATWRRFQSGDSTVLTWMQHGGGKRNSKMDTTRRSRRSPQEG